MVTSIKPSKGFVIVTPWVDETKTFISATETAGEAQTGKVVSVGGDYIENKNLFEAPCKSGDIIVHRYVSDDFTHDNIHYRAVHFAHVLAILK